MKKGEIMAINSRFTKPLMLVLLLLLPLFLLAAGSIGSLALASPGPGWELHATVPGVLFGSISAVDASTAWATGTSPTTGIFKTVDGGTTWTAQVTDPDYSSISPVNASIAYAVGGRTVSKTTDGGATWNTIYSDGSLSAIKVRAFDANNVLVAGGVNENIGTLGRAFIARSSDGGATWTILYQATIHSTIADLSAPTPDVIWAAVTSYEAPTPNGFIAKTADGGATWNDASVKPGTNTVSGTNSVISAVDANTAWTSYRVADGDSSTTAVFKTTDGGATWISKYSLFIQHGGKALITSVDANVAWVTFDSQYPFFDAYPLFGIIVKTIDGGANWITQKVTPGDALTAVSALNTNLAWVTGGHTNPGSPTPVSSIVLRTTDGGGSISVPAVTAVTPTAAGQLTFLVSLTVTGTGFQPGATVSLKRGGSVIGASSVSVDSDTQITASFFLFGADAATYDILVTNPDGSQGTLAWGFNVTPAFPACGLGSGSAVLMLGLALGLLSLAGSTRIRGRRR